MTETTSTGQVNRVYIRASPQAIWDAITTPEWTTRYGYQCPVQYELRPGGAFQAAATGPMKARGAPDVVVDGEVIEADPPRRLVQTWRALFLGEGFTRPPRPPARSRVPGVAGARSSAT